MQQKADSISVLHRTGKRKPCLVIFIVFVLVLCGFMAGCLTFEEAMEKEDYARARELAGQEEDSGLQKDMYLQLANGYENRKQYGEAAFCYGLGGGSDAKIGEMYFRDGQYLEAVPFLQKEISPGISGEDFGKAGDFFFDKDDLKNAALFYEMGDVGAGYIRLARYHASRKTVEGYSEGADWAEKAKDRKLAQEYRKKAEDLKKEQRAKTIFPKIDDIMEAGVYGYINSDTLVTRLFKVIEEYDVTWDDLLTIQEMYQNKALSILDQVLANPMNDYLMQDAQVWTAKFELYVNILKVLSETLN